MQMDLLLSLGWAMILGTGSGFTDTRRGPHHPKESPLPPGVHPKHYRPSHTLDKLTQDTDLIRDVTHIQEDMGRSLDGMSDEELEFYYFKLHDFDKNSLLDGLEMLKAIYHMMDHEHGDEDHDDETTVPSEGEINRYIGVFFFNLNYIIH
jgi:multiple coagulation factor deficiency protein 2